jgi:hypothetical protein
VDGRLSDEDRAAVAFHLLDCSRCQTIVAATEELIDSGRSARTESSAPADLWPLVAATTIHERMVKRHVLRGMRRELGIAAAILMLLSGAAGAFGARIAMRAQDDWGSQVPTGGLRHIGVGPRITVTGVEELAEVAKAKAEIALVEQGFAVTAEAPPIALPPKSPTPKEIMAGEFIAQLEAREGRAFDQLSVLNVSRSRIGEIEDSLFLTNRKLSELRLAYRSDPENSALADELKALFDKRIALIRTAAAEAEARARR